MPSRPEQKWPFRWELLLRYRFIETIALWEGRLTTRHLCDTFGIGRQRFHRCSRGKAVAVRDRPLL